jgi:ParB-like chromosome segregation protein Spo0J
MKVPIAEINVGQRFRKDLGDLQAFADSLKEVGLLQAIGVAPDEKQGYQLVFGQRRLEAAITLGWTHIECKLVKLDSILDGEYHENEMRKDFTPSERVAIGKALEERVGERRGGDTTGADASKRRNCDVCETKGANEVTSNSAVEKTTEEVGNSDTPNDQRKDQLAVNAAGFSSKDTYRRAKTVVEQAEPEVVAAMDSGAMSIHAAAETAELPSGRQKVIAEFFNNGEVKKGREALKQEKAQRSGGKGEKGKGKGKASAPPAEKPPENESAEEAMKCINGLIESYCKELKAKVAEMPDDVWLKHQDRRGLVEQKIKDACEVLRACKCHHVCPICKGDKKHDGKKCQPCLGTGRMPRINYEQAV